MKKELAITDQRMLELMEHCVYYGVNGIERNSEFLEIIGLEPTNLNNIKNGTRGFSKEHLLAAGAKLGADMNFIFGLSGEMFNKQKKITALQQLDMAVRRIKLETRTNVPTTALKQNLKQRAKK